MTATIEHAGTATLPFDEVRRWVFQDALPLWSTTGFDSRAGVFRERLALDGSIEDPGFRRIRVIARQIYVFSHAATIGFAPEGLACAERSFAYLADRAWLGPDKGWARRLTLAGEVEDGTADLYDLAFVLFALAWLVRAGAGGQRARDLLTATHNFLLSRMRHPDGYGFLEAADADRTLREQNPHMHVLESLVAAAQATGERRFIDSAAQVVDLFRSRILDPQTGALREFFGPQWSHRIDETGRLTEPGHQMEWVWLLNQYEQVSGEDMSGPIDLLFGFADRYGIDQETGLTYDGVRDDGAVVKPTFRSWPQTETLKALLARFERTGEFDIARMTAVLSNIREHYLDRTPAGIWFDQLDGERRPVSAFTPASTLYHVFLAYAEFLRLEPSLRKAASALR
ncbi:mannose-6-phosphate isomerase [Marinicauda algicola]|uniref:Mannose-6-phosphate isomerase n=1 Tax=Marinicauda algicola TaxID=2029849 RepID=A0A4S2H3U7_9PROT|nr:AGE family epimerase/isomerase [Marinicauda algicola]TGY90305.1 mannose-6-phosphate isomerase [Marinicauda algicola]